MAKLSGLGGRLYSGETSFNIVENRKRWYSVSAIFIIVSFFALFVQGLHLGIEFKGGASFTVNKPTATVQQAREAVEAVGLPGEIIVQKIGDSKVRVQTGAVDAAQSRAIETALTQKFNVTEESIDTQLVGPSWGKEITRKALYGLFGFLLVVMIYLAMALEPKMAIAAIFAVVHDVFITVGIYALVGFDVTPATIIGFLTILGYSLYDTVVVFDRVRDNTKSISGTLATSKLAPSAANRSITGLPGFALTA